MKERASLLSLAAGKNDNHNRPGFGRAFLFLMSHNSAGSHKKFIGIDKSENCNIFTKSKAREAPIAAAHSAEVLLKLI